MSRAGGLLDRYVLRRFVASYGLCVLGFLLLYLVIDFFGKLDDLFRAEKAVADSGATFWAFVAEYYATKLPWILTITGPYMSLFAAIATLMALNRHNEITPMVASGRSVHRVLAPMYLFAAFAVVGLAAVEERVAPPAQRRYEALDRVLDGDARGEARDPPHLRDRVSGNVVTAKSWFKSDRRLSGVSSPDFRDPQGRLPRGRLDAKDLLWRVHEGVVGWYPRDATITPTGLGDGGRVLPPLRLPPDRALPLRVTPEEIDLVTVASGLAMSRPELAALAARYPLRYELQMQFHARTARPVSSLVLLLLGLPFVLGTGQRTIAAGLGVALGTCAVYMGADFLCLQLGNRGDVQPLVAAWLAPSFFGALAIARLDRVPT